jgi:hypothetical protein
MTKIRIIVLAVLFCGCSHHRTLPESLTSIFSDRLRRIDSAAILDSLHVRWNIPVTQKMGRIFDDSIYMREYSRVQSQLAGALSLGDRDSIAFYKYEIHYMEQEIDSIGHSIGLGDSTRRYGTVVGCSFYIRKNNKLKMDSTIVFIDTTSMIRFTDFIDSALRRTVKMLQAP